MKIIRIILLILTIQAQGVLALTPNEPSAPGLQSQNDNRVKSAIFFDHDRFDFGKIYSKKELSHTFTLHNNSQSQVEITEIKTDCGCTAAIMDQTPLEAGAFAQITMTIQPEQLSGFEKKQATVYVRQDDKIQWFNLTITAEMTNLLKIYPEHVYFKKIYYGEGGSEEVIISTEKNEDISITGIEALEGHFELSFSPFPEVSDTSIDDPKIPVPQKVTRWKCIITLPKDTPAGRFQGKIGINTTSSTQPQISFPVFGVVRSQISILPTQCYFGSLQPGKNYEKTITITNTGEGKLPPPKIVCDLDSITYELETTESEKSYNLIIKLHVPEQYDGKLSTQIKIKLQDPTLPEFELPVFGYIYRSSIVNP